MINKGMIKRVFPGNNTSEGFYSYYDNIVDETDSKLFIIKGGPGVGKSSFIKKIADEMLNRGYDVEFHHCSSDSHSLDGIAIHDFKTAIIDGTAPHIVDPKYPAVVDEILYFGGFWDEAGIYAHKNDIIAVTKEIKELFQRAYRFLAAAKFIRDDIENIYENACDHGKFNYAIEVLIDEMLGGFTHSQKPGKLRRLFGSAYTPEGHVDYYDTIIGSSKDVIYINSNYVKGTSFLMQRVAEVAIKKGLFVEAYHEPLVPQNMETIIIPQANIAITGSDRYSEKNIKTIDFSHFIDSVSIEKNREILAEDQYLLKEIINKALANIKKAKEKHDILEGFYASNMDFKKIDLLRADIISKIIK